MPNDSSIRLDRETLQRFQANLLRINDWTSAEIASALELGANAVKTAAQADHPRPASRAEARAHPHKRFYSWRGITAGAIHAGPVRSSGDGARIEVVSPERHSQGLEYGTPRSRAFPFLGPALASEQETVMRHLIAGVARAVGKATT